MTMTMTMTHTHTHIYIMFMYIHRYPHIRYLPTNTPQMCSTYAFTLFGAIESQRADDQRYFWQCDKKVFSNDYLSCSLTFWLTDGLWTMKQDDLQHLLSKSQFQHLQWPSGRCHSGTRRFRAAIRHPWSSMWAIWVICRRPVASRFPFIFQQPGMHHSKLFFWHKHGQRIFSLGHLYRSRSRAHLTYAL